MELDMIAKKLNWKLLTKVETAGITIRNGYTGDLLSDVLANSEPEALWITIQKHKNILGVAAAKDLSAIVISGGILPDDDLVRTAETRKIPVFISEEDAFVISGKLYMLMANHDIQN